MKNIFILLFLAFAVSAGAQTKHIVPIAGGGTGPWNSADSLKILQSTGTLAPLWTSASGLGIISTPISVANGGSGQSSALTAHGIVYASTTSAMASTAAGTTTTVLHGNASGAPSYGAVTLTTDVTGTLAATHGGTGATTLPAALILLLPDTTGNTDKTLAVQPGGGFYWK